jgi:hypothetical protein
MSLIVVFGFSRKVRRQSLTMNIQGLQHPSFPLNYGAGNDRLGVYDISNDSPEWTRRGSHGITYFRPTFVQCPHIRATEETSASVVLGHRYRAGCRGWMRVRGAARNVWLTECIHGARPDNLIRATWSDNAAIITPITTDAGVATVTASSGTTTSESDGTTSCISVQPELLRRLRPDR